MKINIPEKVGQRTAFVIGGLDGASFAAVLCLATSNDMDTPQKSAVYFFAVAIPFLTTALVNVTYRNADGATALKSEFILMILTSIGGVCAMVGIGALMFHFSTLVGGIFVISGFFAFAIGFCAYLIHVKARDATLRR